MLLGFFNSVIFALFFYRFFVYFVFGSWHRSRWLKNFVLFLAFINIYFVNWIVILIRCTFVHFFLYFGRMSLFIIHYTASSKRWKRTKFFLHFLSFQTQAKASMHYIRLAFFFRMVRFLFVFFLFTWICRQFWFLVVGLMHDSD